jgi:hypothetical protein
MPRVGRWRNGVRAQNEDEDEDGAGENVDHYAPELVEARFRAAEALGYPVTREPPTKHVMQHRDTDTRPQEYDSWLLEKKVRVRSAWAEEDVGDSCCFGTRTVDTGMDCMWKLHGGI